MTFDAYVPWKCPFCPHINKTRDPRAQSHAPGWKAYARCPGCGTETVLLRMSDGQLVVTRHNANSGFN